MMKSKTKTTLIHMILRIAFDLFELIFIGAGLFFFYPRVQYIIETPDHDLGIYWSRFISDIHAHPLTYIIFFVLIIIWVVIKAIYIVKKESQ